MRNGQLLPYKLLVVCVAIFGLALLPRSGYGEAPQGATSPNERVFRFDYPKPNSALTGRITAKGPHNYGISSHIWIVLSDGYGYYLQSPEVTLYDTSWVHDNVTLGGNIKSIVVVLVTDAGNETFSKMASEGSWGQFRTLPAGSRRIAALPIRN